MVWTCRDGRFRHFANYRRGLFRILDGAPHFWEFLAGGDSCSAGVFRLSLQWHAATSVFFSNALLPHTGYIAGGAAPRTDRTALLAAAVAATVGESAHSVHLRLIRRLPVRGRERAAAVA